MSKLKQCFKQLRSGMNYVDKTSIDDIFPSLSYGEKALVLACWEVETGTAYKYRNMNYDADHKYLNENEDLNKLYKEIICN
ncbi:MAG: hypothetical protein RR620_08360 [Clostridium sp.]